MDVCMYVCMYVYVCVCVYVCIYAFMHAWLIKMTKLLDIIHRLFFIKTHDVSETGVFLRHQVKRKPVLLGPIDRASPYLRTTEVVRS
jgi:hypothetical protein